MLMAFQPKPKVRTSDVRADHTALPWSAKHEALGAWLQAAINIPATDSSYADAIVEPIYLIGVLLLPAAGQDARRYYPAICR
jgi:hypothetical protein